MEQNSKLNLELINSEAQSVNATSRNEAVKLNSNLGKESRENNANLNTSS